MPSIVLENTAVFSNRGIVRLAITIVIILIIYACDRVYLIWDACSFEIVRYSQYGSPLLLFVKKLTSYYERNVPGVYRDKQTMLFLGCTWRHNFLKSKTDLYLSVTEQLFSSKSCFVRKQALLKFQSCGGAWHKAMRDIKLCVNAFKKKKNLDRDFEPF